MKRIFTLLTLFILVLVGCGTSNSNDEDTSQGSEGNEQSLPKTDELEEEDKTDDITQLLNELQFNVDVNTNKDSAAFNMELTNTSSEDLTLGFSSGQQYEIVIKDKNTDQELYRYSEDKMFTEALEYKELQSNETIQWTSDWTLEGDIQGTDFIATVSLMPMSVNDISIESNPFIEEIEFSIEKEKEESGEIIEGNDAFRNINVTGSNGNYTVTGEARVFEAQFMYFVEDGHSILIDPTPVMAEQGAPSWGKFEFPIEIEQEQLPKNGTLLLVIYEESAKDGSSVNELVVPLEQFN